MNINLRVINCLEKYSISRGSGILIGLSGGADSVCLFLILESLKHKFNLKIEAAYICHNIRDKSEGQMDTDFVRSLCVEHSVVLHELHLQNDSLVLKSRAEGLSLEATARKVRYDYFEKILAERNLNYLALGHHADDQAETVLMRFCQGSMPAGLKGIPEVNKNILRPLLNCRKYEILNYLQNCNQKFQTDITNNDNQYLRNAVRNKLLPDIVDVFPGFYKSIAVFQEKNELVDSFLKEKIQNKLKLMQDGSPFIEIDEYCSLHMLEKMNLLYIVIDLQEKTQTDTRIPYEQIKNIINIIDKSFKKSIILKNENSELIQDNFVSYKNQCLYSGSGLSVWLEGNLLIFKYYVVINTKKEYFIVVNDQSKINLFGRFIQVFRANDYVPGVSDICLEISLEDSMVMRSWRDGDVICLDGHKKSLKQLFSDWKVPEKIKLMIPVIESRDGIAAVWGYPFGFENSISCLYYKKDRLVLKNAVYFSMTEDMEFDGGRQKN